MHFSLEPAPDRLMRHPLGLPFLYPPPFVKQPFLRVPWPLLLEGDKAGSREGCVQGKRRRDGLTPNFPNAELGPESQGGKQAAPVRAMALCWGSVQFLNITQDPGFLVWEADYLSAHLWGLILPTCQWPPPRESLKCVAGFSIKNINRKTTTTTKPRTSLFLSLSLFYFFMPLS